MKKILIFVGVFLLAMTAGFFYMKAETAKIMTGQTQQQVPQVAPIAPAPITTPAPPKVEPKPLTIPTGKEEIAFTKIQLPNQPGTYNAKVAAKILNGHVVKSGETFSYNGVVGERTKAKGFISGTMPETDSNGNMVMVDEVGSGVCRVAVWTATQAKKSGCKDVAITHHQYTPQYILDNPGLVDATVFWDGGTDYKFKNTNPYDILIECQVTDDFVLQGYFYKLIY